MSGIADVVISDLRGSVEAAVCVVCVQGLPFGDPEKCLERMM